VILFFWLVLNDGLVPAVFASYFCAARLIPLRKSLGGYAILR